MAESYLDHLDEQFLAVSHTEGWEPTTDAEADWALMKIRQAQMAVAAKEAERTARMQDLDAYVEKETRRARHETIFFEAKLHGYLLRLRDEGQLGRQKGYDLPSGRLQLRSLKDKYEPSDKAALLAWAERCGYVKFKVEVDMDMVRQALAEGVEVPGMVLVRQAGESFSVQLTQDQKGGEVDHEKL